jgi:hypothetical protein
MNLLVPNVYFNHLDHSGRRMDWFQRPELCLGAYEILATKQYCKVCRFQSTSPVYSIFFFRMKNGLNYPHLYS